MFAPIPAHINSLFPLLFYPLSYCSCLVSLQMTNRSHLVAFNILCAVKTTYTTGSKQGKANSFVEGVWDMYKIVGLAFTKEGATFSVSVSRSEVDCRRLALDFRVLKPRDWMKTLKYKNENIGEKIQSYRLPHGYTYWNLEMKGALLSSNQQCSICTAICMGPPTKAQTLAITLCMPMLLWKCYRTLVDADTMSISVPYHATWVLSYHWH